MFPLDSGPQRMTAPLAQTWRLSHSREWTLNQPRVLGILNVTPDSFSDGGLHVDTTDALRAAERMLALGADGLDIGGESTRPGAQRIDTHEQIRRVVPVIHALRARLGDSWALTIDTTLAPVAQAALDAGADAINDISAGADDPDMIPLAASRACGIVLMHRLRMPARDSYSTAYIHAPEYPGGVLASVQNFLMERSENAMRAGIRQECILLDPGLGFGKSVEQNLELIRRTPRLLESGFPVLSAVSRKSFTARAAGLPDQSPPTNRVHASVGLSVAHLHAGARIFRVHDVAEHVQALRAAWACLAR